MRAVGKTFARENNKKLVLSLIYHNSPVSRTQIVKLSNLSKVTVTRVVNDLMRDGLIFEADHVASNGGRPQVPLSLIANSRFAIGVDVGVSEIRIGICDLLGNVLKSSEKVIEPKVSGTELVNMITGSLKELIAGSGINRNKFLGIGISMPGVIDTEKGAVTSSFVLKGSNIELKKHIEAAVKLDTMLDRDANAGLFYEMFSGCGVGIDDILYVYTRNNEKGELGIGCSFLLGGRIYRGTEYFAGEIGLAGGENGSDLFSFNEAISLLNVIEAAKAGDAGAREALLSVSRKLGKTMAFIVNLLNPALVIIGGDFAAAGQMFLDPVEVAMREKMFEFSTKNIKIRPSSVTEEAGIKAAAFMVVAKMLGYK